MNEVLITGQQWVSQSYFDATHAADIREQFAAGKNFKLGAADNGIDIMAQRLLIQLCEETKSEESFKRVTIFDKKDKDGRLDKRFLLSNGYPDYPARDTQMALQCKSEPICKLAQHGNGTSGAANPLLISSLMTSKSFADALEEFAGCVRNPLHYNEISPSVKNKLVVSLVHDVCNILRSHSEQWDNDFVRDVVAPTHEKYYKK